MPSVIVNVPQFPSVPILPGVPQLVRSLTSPAPALPTIGAQAQGPLWSSRNSAVWGVFDSNGKKVINPDSVLDFSNRNEWDVSDYQQQANSNNTGTGFGSFNKVTKPSETSLRFSKGGSQSDRSTFLNQIAAIAGDTNVYKIVTPEVSYSSVNVLRYEVLRRGASGAYFLCEVDVFFRQVLVVAANYTSTSANTANAQNAAAIPAQNNGNVQPQTVASRDSQSFLAALAGVS